MYSVAPRKGWLQANQRVWFTIQKTGFKRLPKEKPLGASAETEIAATGAEGPGIGITGIFSSTQSFTCIKRLIRIKMYGKYKIIYLETLELLFTTGNYMTTSHVFGIFTLVFVHLLYGPYLAHSGVTYDRKAIVINGQRRILISGSIHYPRSTPEMWENLVNHAKNGGLNVIDTYVFWNIHEPSPGKYNFEGRYDLVSFIKTVRRAGLYVNLRIGPYICAEWNFGGFPVWLRDVEGISFRTDNEPFKNAMQGFTEKIISMLKSESLFASQGGPIILSQIENEYGSESKALGDVGYKYVTWAANMAVGMGTGVPWMMCKEEDAPDPVINACNGFYCDYFSPNKPYKPKMWTEAWTSWFSEFGGPRYKRPVEDLAFAVARFVHSGGSFFNYYMYHGGTNFGRTAGGPFVTTSYDYDAPIDEYGLIREPKFGHLKELHKAIKLSEEALVASDPTTTSLGEYQEAYVFSPGNGKCSAFLANYDMKSEVWVDFRNSSYALPPWSISILPDCKNVIFNTAKVGVQTSRMGMMPAGSGFSSWESYDEEVPSDDDGSKKTSIGLLEQLSVTMDQSDYLWYMTSVDIGLAESFGGKGKVPTLSIRSKGHSIHVFINGELVGSAFGTRENRGFTYISPIKLQHGRNNVALLSVAVGLQNVGRHFETWSTGILGPVYLHGLDEGHRDLSWQKWSYQVGLKGEEMDLLSPGGVSSIPWFEESLSVKNRRHLRWHKASFESPDGDEPLALDMGSMGKGQIWVNGVGVGRYWTARAHGNCSRCGYAGTFRPSKCQFGCGRPTQRWYHLPRSWLRPKQNLLVVFEELGGDPYRISLVKRSVMGVCSDTHEHHHSETAITPNARIHCGSGRSISAIKFASFGNPSGSCGSFRAGSCNSPNSVSVLEKMCKGRESCSVAVSHELFGADPCPNSPKRLTVEAVCGVTV